MSQNGDDAEVRDAMINPVQRRESSAARFLKHFRPDRNNPAYHSEGKGLRKRRNWASERQLTTNTDNSNPVVASSANDPPPAGAAAAQSQRSVANTPQRSHSFSEPDAASGSGSTGRTSFKENSGMRESFRWRFGSSKSSSWSSKSSSSDHTPKGGDTCKSPAGHAPPLSSALSSSGVNENSTHSTTTTVPPPPCSNSNNNLNNTPAAGNNWSQLHHIPGGHYNNKSPSKNCIHDSTTVVDGRTSSVQLKQENQNQTEPIYSNGKAQTGVRVVNYYAATSGGGGAADADYVNYEMFASHQYNWNSNHQKQLEPDLIRNLPYQQQQQGGGSTVATSINSPTKQTPFTNPSPHHRHSNGVVHSRLVFFFFFKRIFTFFLLAG